VQGGIVQGGIVQGGIVQGGIVQGGIVQGGAVQYPDQAPPNYHAPTSTQINSLAYDVAPVPSQANTTIHSPRKYNSADQCCTGCVSISLFACGGIFLLIGAILLGVGIPQLKSAGELDASEDFIDLGKTCSIVAANYRYTRSEDRREQSYKENGRTRYRTVYDIECKDCYDWDGTLNTSTAVHRVREQCRTRVSVRGEDCSSFFSNDLCDRCPSGTPWPGSFTVNETVQCWVARDPPPPEEYTCYGDYGSTICLKAQDPQDDIDDAKGDAAGLIIGGGVMTGLAVFCLVPALIVCFRAQSTTSRTV